MDYSVPRRCKDSHDVRNDLVDDDEYHLDGLGDVAMNDYMSLVMRMSLPPSSSVAVVRRVLVYVGAWHFHQRRKTMLHCCFVVSDGVHDLVEHQIQMTMRMTDWDSHQE